MEHEHDRRAAGFQESERERGEGVTRLEGFVDAAFAFAVTLLVISIDTIPDSLDDLLLALRDVPAFGLSFAIIAMFWGAHARWSRRYRLQDGWVTVLSLCLVFLVLVYVYPLKMMFSSFMASISAGFLSPNAFGRDGAAVSDVLWMFVIYGLIFVTLSLCLIGLHLRSWLQQARLRLRTEQRLQLAAELAAYGWFVVVGLLSVVVALLIPTEITRSQAWLIGMPGALYTLLALTGVAGMLGHRWGARRTAPLVLS